MMTFSSTFFRDDMAALRGECHGKYPMMSQACGPARDHEYGISDSSATKTRRRVRAARIAPTRRTTSEAELFSNRTESPIARAAAGRRRARPTARIVRD